MLSFLDAGSIPAISTILLFMRKSYKFGRRKRTHDTGKKFRSNESIRAAVLFVIDENGESLGELERANALKKAEERGFDLVEVGPNSNPPVAKFLNYGSFQYKQQKLVKLQKKQQKKVETKGVRISMKIAQGDLETKIKQAEKFLNKGHKVKVELILRGRELRHINLAKDLIHDFLKKLENEFTVEQDVTKQGHKLFTILLPKE